MRANHRAVCGVRRAAHLIALVVIFALSSCGGSGTGDSDNSLSGAVGSTRAHYQIVDLASGRVTATGSMPDLLSNPRYRSTSMVFRLVEVTGGTIGSGASQLGAALDPAAAAAGTASYYLAVFETTQAQWMALAGNTPWTLLTSVNGADDVRIGDDYPAVGISNDLATSALASYRSTSGVTLALPSDTQWEIACRAGGSSTWAWGDNATTPTVTAAAVVWETAGTTRGARPVGQRVASALGFFDLHGNVWEVTSGGNLRGGSWNDPVATARAAHRAAIDPAIRHLLVGVRLVYVP